MKVFKFEPIDSRMYVKIEKESAVIIDPFISEEAMEYLKHKDVKNVEIILTHEHYDHISGVNWLRGNFEHVSVLCSKNCAEAIENTTKNLAAFSSVLLMNQEGEPNDYGWDTNYSCSADQVFEKEYSFSWNGHYVYLKETPGHSMGSICIMMDGKYLFSGDSLVTGYSTITRLPGGSKKKYKEITIPFLKSLDSEIVVCPGHGERQILKQYDIG